MRISRTLLKQLLFRNRYSRYGRKSVRKNVNLEYFSEEVNLGDILSPIVYLWMLNEKRIDPNKVIKKTKHLMAIGSILGGNGFFDATVWGSGIKSFDQVVALSKRRYFQKLDIRAVRGPLTREILVRCGYQCPEIFGDPAILMPMIYDPISAERVGTGVVLHYHSQIAVPQQVKNINVRTTDFRSFIDQICSCEKIVASSLHGIIIAESYGIPTVFLSEGQRMEMLKYYDWFLATGRKNFMIADTLEEALEMEPTPLPDLSLLRKNIISAFPYDLWEESYSKRR